MLLQEQRTVCIKVDVIQSLGLLLDSTVLDETWALTRASNKPLYAFALLWMSYSLSFGDSDTGHNSLSCPGLSFQFFAMTRTEGEEMTQQIDTGLKSHVHLYLDEI